MVRVVGRGGATAGARVERPVEGLRRAVGLVAPRPASCRAPSAQAFERVVVTKDEALELFKGNPFKQALLTSKTLTRTP